MTHPVKDAMPELKPCPFCGETRISFNPKTDEFEGSINCPGCLASIPREVNDDQELIDCWNTRADLAHQEALDVEALKIKEDPKNIPYPKDVWDGFRMGWNKCLHHLANRLNTPIPESRKALEACDRLMRFILHVHNTYEPHTRSKQDDLETIRAALTHPPKPVDVNISDLQYSIDEARKCLEASTSYLDETGKPVRVNGLTQLTTARLIDCAEKVITANYEITEKRK